MKLETSRNVTKSKRSLHWCRSISKKYLCTFYYSISQKVITLSGRTFITVSGGFITLSGSYYSIGRFYYIIGQLLQYRAFITLSVGTAPLAFLDVVDPKRHMVTVVFAAIEVCLHWCIRRINVRTYMPPVLQKNERRSNMILSRGPTREIFLCKGFTQATPTNPFTSIVDWQDPAHYIDSYVAHAHRRISLHNGGRRSLAGGRFFYRVSNHRDEINVHWSYCVPNTIASIESFHTNVME